MRFTVLTLFPELIHTAVGTSITGRALKSGAISVDTVNIRDFSVHGTMRVDDYPYGGGAGMVMEAEPVYRAVKSVEEKSGKLPRVIYLTPQAEVLDQIKVEELAREEELVLICGHYEGIDERVLEEVVTDYVSIGDYVLTGGELAACVLIDAVSRFVPGVLHNDDSSQFESFQDNLLEYPHYTRPEIWHDKKVPEVLLSGDHAAVEKWRYEKSVERTAQRRPDLMAGSYSVTALWFGDEEARLTACGLAAAVSRYGTVLDYNRKKLRKQVLRSGKNDLLLISLPRDPGAEMPVSERFRNISGDNAPAVLAAPEGAKGIREAAAFLEERGYMPAGIIEVPEDGDEDCIRDAAIGIRKSLDKRCAGWYNLLV